MPHIVIECSENFSKHVSMPDLIAAIHNAASQTGIFPFGGIRTRAFISQHYETADSPSHLHPQNSQCHLRLTLGAGRTLAAKEKACKHIYHAGLQFLEKQNMLDYPKQVFSFTAKEAPATLSYKHNNIHSYLQSRKRV